MKSKAFNDIGPTLINSDRDIGYITNPKLMEHVNLFKNKIKFRELIKDLYPDFFFKEVKFDEIGLVSPEFLPFPIVIKPNYGYCGIGVNKVYNIEQWHEVCKKLKKEVQVGTQTYPKFVFNPDSLIIEESIQGDEYAIDAFFSEIGKPVILNIMRHPYLNEYDTSDSIYYTSIEVIKENLKEITDFLERMNKKLLLKRFPFHLEIRKTADGQVIPIELNPLRFSGEGTCDLSYYAFRIRSLKYFFKQKSPDWDKILSSDNDHVYSFFVAGTPENIPVSSIVGVKEEELKKEFSNILDYRPAGKENLGIFLAIVFFKTRDFKECNKYLSLDLKKYIALKNI